MRTGDRTVVFFKFLLIGVLVAPIVVLSGYLLNNLLDYILDNRKTDKK